MVSKKKLETVKEVKDQIKDYTVIGILDMHKLPARQLYEIRNKLRDSAVIRMVKKRLIKIILEEIGESNGLKELENHIRGEPALLLSRTNPFKLARTLEESKSSAPAKAGDIAPRDIVVKAGPTSLAPGPVIGELQRVKIPASVEGEKIAVKQDTVVAKEGDEITRPLADILSKLGIEPMEIGLNLLAAWEDGTIYTKDVLFIPQDHYLNGIITASQEAFNLSITINYYTQDTVPALLSRAKTEADSLALKANVITSDTIKTLLSKASSDEKTLRKITGK